MLNFFSLLKKYYTNIYIRNSILIIVALFFSLLSNSFQSSINKVNPFSLILLGLTNIGLIIIYNHFILRLFLFKRKYFLFFILFILFIAILTFHIMYITRPLLNKPIIGDFKVFLPDVIFNTVLISFFYFLHYNFLKYIKQQDIITLNQKTEIEQLKQQLNPHFLLNSLNNLYGVSLSHPASVPNKIIELTDLLKYQIETSRKDYNTLFDEKNFIDNYIAYSKWKLQNITINTFETGVIKNYLVTPMVFLPLIENAIKYSNFDQNPIINLNWTFSDNKLIFTITNAYKDNQSELFSTKSGLKNLRKRLELFHPESKFEINENSNNFKASVTIWNLTIHA